jgi:hypothetical protein
MSADIETPDVDPAELPDGAPTLVPEPSVTVEPSEETPEAPADPETPAAPEAPVVPMVPEAAAPALTAFERTRLRAMGLGGLIKEVEANRGEIARLSAANLTAHQTVATLTAKLEGMTARHAAALADAKAGREDDVSKGVRAELATIGITEAAAPGVSAEVEAPVELLARFQKMQGAERTAFFRANKQKLLAAEAAVAKTA